MDKDTKAILKAILDALEDDAWYYSQTGQKMHLLILNRYREGNISGLVLASVSGGSYLVDDIPLGKQPHGTAYWLPRVPSQIVELLADEKTEEPADEGFGEEPTIGVERKPITVPTR